MELCLLVASATKPITRTRRLKNINSLFFYSDFKTQIFNGPPFIKAVQNFQIETFATALHKKFLWKKAREIQDVSSFRA